MDQIPFITDDFVIPIEAVRPIKMNPDGFKAIIGIIFMRMKTIQQDGIALFRSDVTPVGNKSKLSIDDMRNQ